MKEASRNLLAIAGGSLALGLAATAWRRRPRYELRGKVAFVTGGSRGLGLVLARQLVERGARVAICARDPLEVARAHDHLRKYGEGVLAMVCDVTDSIEVAATVFEIERQLGPIDVLVNNAGRIQVGPMESMTLDDYSDAMRLHFFGPLHTTLAVLPSMRRRRTGRIANISSIGGKVAAPHLLPYSASKFALTGLSEGLRTELQKHNIAVTTVCPGLMRTGSAPHAQLRGREEEEYAWFATTAAAPLISMSAERAARTILNGVVRGDAEVIVGMPAKLAAVLHGISAPATASFLALIDRYLLPEAPRVPQLAPVL